MTEITGLILIYCLYQSRMTDEEKKAQAKKWADDKEMRHAIGIIIAIVVVLLKFC